MGSLLQSSPNPTWRASSESLHCGQAGDICWLQEQQRSPFPKHLVYPKATVRISTRNQDNPTALTSPFLTRHQNPWLMVPHILLQCDSHSCDSAAGSFDSPTFSGHSSENLISLFREALMITGHAPGIIIWPNYTFHHIKCASFVTHRLVFLCKIVT